MTSQAAHEAGQLADLRALGIEWDEPVVRQSERRSAHEAAIESLVDRGLTYPCFCSRREVREAERGAARRTWHLPGHVPRPPAGGGAAGSSRVGRRRCGCARAASR